LGEERNSKVGSASLLIVGFIKTLQLIRVLRRKLTIYYTGKKDLLFFLPGPRQCEEQGGTCENGFKPG
jgi:hypothetical protein